MCPISVVIITQNEEANIRECIRSAKLLSQDVVIVDAESTDATLFIAQCEGARVFTKKWETYGAARNFGAQQAHNNWIVALDADERITESLVGQIKQLSFTDPQVVYRFRRHNFLGRKKITFGTLAFEKVSRLYHRSAFAWDLTLVHECLEGAPVKKKIIKGYINHFGLKDMADHRTKATRYAQLCADKYFMAQKKATLVKCILSPFFNATKSYLFAGGFLTGKDGFQLAKNIFYYSWLKYSLLRSRYALEREKINQQLPQMEPVRESIFSS